MAGRCRNVVVMGVCGAGKSTLASHLAGACGGHFLEGDSFHPPQNIAAMANGIALTDEARWVWLERICDAVEALNARDGAPVFVACSALKSSYRNLLRGRTGALAIIHLDGDSALIRRRMLSRRGHFMPPSLLDSQLRDLEPPEVRTEFPVGRFDIANSAEQVLEEAVLFCRRHVASAGRSFTGELPRRQQLP